MKVIFVEKSCVNYVLPSDLESIKKNHFPQADFHMLDTRPIGALNAAGSTVVTYFKNTEVIGYAVFIEYGSVVSA